LAAVRFTGSGVKAPIVEELKSYQQIKNKIGKHAHSYGEKKEEGKRNMT